ncbi:MAG: DedA family protein [Deltaproteobacteria bacterium]|nr:DedA family protein [Deltaproteobacteria bacterium]
MFEFIFQAWHWFFDVFMHLDQHLAEWAILLGPWLHVLLFAIVFAETGLVVTPVLPGDSLLFAVGALASVPASGIHLIYTMGLLMAAAISGDAVNYGIGKYVGPKIFTQRTSTWLNKKHLDRTHEFYEKHGGKTIILARFIPIIRTFAPFVAGIGKMGYPRFALFNVMGGIGWVGGFIFSGYFFGNLPLVKQNFQFVMVGIVLISTLPIVCEVFRSYKK